MGTLWANNDVQTRFRRNREAIATRLLYPFFDTDDAAAVTLTPVVTRVALGTSIGVVWSVPGGLHAAVIGAISITNTHTASVTVSLYAIEPGQTTASVARTIFNNPLGPGETVTLDLPITMASSSSIRGLATVGSVVNVRVDALTFASQPAGLNLRVIEGVALTTSLSAALYTCPGAPTQHSVLLSAILCNTDSATRTPELYLVPPAGSAGVSNIIFDQALVAQESAGMDTPYIVEQGAFFQTKGSVSSVMSLRLSVLELATS